MTNNFPTGTTESRPPKKSKAAKNELSDSTSSSDEETKKRKESVDEDNNSSNWSAKDSIDLEIKEMRRQEKLKEKQAKFKKDSEQTELGQ